jgi:hypothetical protein
MVSNGQAWLNVAVHVPAREAVSRPTVVERHLAEISEAAS